MKLSKLILTEMVIRGRKCIVCAAAEEQVTIDFAFATVVAIRDIKKGESFTKENMWVKRPGTGEIPAEDYPNVLGKKATCDIASDAQIKKSMVESL